MRPIQRAFVQAGAVKRAWRIYLQELGVKLSREDHALGVELLEEPVAYMSDSTIRRIARELLQCDDITDQEAAQLYVIIHWRNKKDELYRM